MLIGYFTHLWSIRHIVRLVFVEVEGNIPVPLSVLIQPPETIVEKSKHIVALIPSLRHITPIKEERGRMYKPILVMGRSIDCCSSTHHTGAAKGGGANGEDEERKRNRDT